VFSVCERSRTESSWLRRSEMGTPYLLTFSAVRVAGIVAIHTTLGFFTRRDIGPRPVASFPNWLV